MAPLRFLFDYVSPYSYLAWTQIHALAERHAREVEATPVLLAGLLDARGTLGPAEVPAKRAYVIKDVVRLAHALGVPVSLPSAHPFNPLRALRVSSLPMAATTRRALVDRLYEGAWRSGLSISEAATVAAIARDVGLPATAIADAESEESKARLRRQTDAAIAEGAFGVPTIFADGELFFGVDSLPHLERFLRGEDPVRPELVEQWARLPAAATRKRG